MTVPSAAVPDYWSKLIPLLQAAKKDPALLSKLKSADAAEITSVLADYGLSADDLEKAKADVKGFEGPAAYGIWFYAPVPD